MRIAITGAAGLLGQALAEQLASDHDVLATDIDEVDVLDADACARLCDGADRVIHLARAHRRSGDAAADGDSRILDTALKGTYNVMFAARHAGVAQVVQVSDICVYSGYDDQILLSEDMVGLPDTSAEQQAVHLADRVGHEFTREAPGSILTLRLGHLVDVTTLPSSTLFDRDWLDVSDATAAIRRGLELDTYDHPSHWGLYNLVADTPTSRFQLRIREGRFAFQPRVDFRSWWPEEVGA